MKKLRTIKVLISNKDYQQFKKELQRNGLKQQVVVGNLIASYSEERNCKND